MFFSAIALFFFLSHILDTSGSFKRWAVVTVTEGEITVLHCSAPSNGSETPGSVWSKEPGESLTLLEPLDTDDEDNVKDGKYWTRVNGDLSIKIYGTKMEDAGMYHCRFPVGNEYRTKVVELVVEGMVLSKK